MSLEKEFPGPSSACEHLTGDCSSYPRVARNVVGSQHPGWFLDICNKNPSEGAAEAEVEGEGAGTICRNCSVVDGLECIVALCVSAISMGREYDTNFHTSVCKETVPVALSLT